MKKLILALAIGFSMFVSASEAFSFNQQDQKIKEIIRLQAEKNNIPVDFAYALVYVESRYNPTVRGAKGEYGLGQILCSTAKSMGYVGKCEGLRDPETNLKYTMLYLKSALDQAGGDLCHASAIYSSGNPRKPKRPSAYCKLVLAQMK
ncbi:LT_GEWL domain containing protein [uncultured Caudovirales phage]|uniref:LT_GEWL domain containing protein n=1 Tax=uncultured Caudovirales phage TaxID=2100421 RepID=A0A6J7X074_9CAUD|nr:LT_GEWL domain containing protein [uncultured Caudovirales phage]